MKFIPLSFLGSCLGIIFALPAEAQITTDGTTNTTLTPTSTGITIENGKAAEANLFHSFGEFSVPRGSEAYFNNSNDIVNIFSRVTGGKISNIDGLIRANGEANLFLINPHGIIFGEGARLNIGGSFYGTTADSILFPDGEFSTTNLSNSPLLTVNAPIGLKFRDQPGDIVNQSLALQVRSGKTLGLIGGDLRFNGGIVTATKLELGSVANEGIANLKETPQGLEVEYETLPKFGDIQLNQQALLRTNGIEGSTIRVQGGTLSIQDGSQIIALTQNVDGGNILINVDELFISNQAVISAVTTGSGDGGDIAINATEGIEIIGTGFDEYQETFILGSLRGTTSVTDLQQGTGLIVLTSGTGTGGNITLDTPSLRISNGGVILNPTFGEGVGGNITIHASELVELIGSALQSGNIPESNGSAGDIVVQAKNLVVRDGGIIVNATLGDGSGGDIDINVAETIELSNTLIQAFIPTGILVNSSVGNGQAGDVTINANNLFANQGAVINNNSGALILNQPVAGEILRLEGGNSGKIAINVSDSIEFSGIGSNGITTSGISSTAFGRDSSAGNIDITTDNLVVRDGARIDAATIGSGAGGTITVIARESILVSGTSPVREPLMITEIPSSITATSGRIDIPTGGTGKAGNLNITTKDLVIQDEARIGVDALSLGEAGELRVFAESIILDNEARINASTNAIQGGNIELTVDKTIKLRNESLISAQAGNDANGGNITINADFIIAFPNQNNDIVARAEQGLGGNINITAEGVFGLQQRNSNPSNQTNDIDASSDLGLDGTVSISTLDAGAFQEIIEAPETFEQQRLEAFACPKKDTTTASSLTITGRGGVPPEVTEPLNSDAIIVEKKFVSIIKKEEEPQQPETIQSVATAQGKIYPARGVIVDDQGDIILTAYPTNNPQRIPSGSQNCR